MYDPMCGDGCGKAVPIQFIEDEARAFMHGWDEHMALGISDEDHYAHDPSYNWAKGTKAKRAASKGL